MTLFEYKSAMKMRSRPLYDGSPLRPPVLAVSARTGHGVPEAWADISGLTAKLQARHAARLPG